VRGRIALLRVNKRRKEHGITVVGMDERRERGGAR
jgi:hypothetical protein